jgi:hypothetical protein
MPHLTAFAVPAAARTSLRSKGPSQNSTPASVIGLRPPQRSRPARHTLIEKNGFAIRIADERSSVAVDSLVRRMYSRRGYCLDDAAEARTTGGETSVTLEALQGATTIGTLTVNCGALSALNAEALYAEEIAPYRRAGLRPCEFTRLAMGSDDSSKEALAGMFHVGIVFAFKVFGATDLFIEVNPRHAVFYRRKIGFALIGEERICPRVDAPAVLLHKDLALCTEELSRLGGLRDPSNRSFYAFALTPDEERVVVSNLRAPIRLAS